jgi:hypothetical protein
MTGRMPAARRHGRAARHRRRADVSVAAAGVPGLRRAS